MKPALTLIPALYLAFGCGPGTTAEAIRPKEQTAAEALGEGQCRDVSRGAEPLVVDWKPEERGELEVAMKEGVAVMAYSCDTIRLLEDCRLEGGYGFIGMTRREQVVQLESSDELKANLPLTGASIGGELERGATLDIAMILVGKRRTTWREASRADLSGSCDGATHYVRGAMVGAFALETGTRAKVRAAAELFAAEIGGGSQSSRRVQNRDGDPKDCAKSLPDADAPPPQCGAPIRLALMPIAAAPSKEPASRPVVDATERSEPLCPAGLVASAGKCTAASSAPAYQCAADDVAECTAQCDKGHAGSCGSLGALLMSGPQRDEARAAGALKKGCDGKEGRACSLLGVLTAEGRGTAPDAKAAATLYRTACDLGDPLGCASLGRLHTDGRGVARDAGKALALLEQACHGGQDSACADAAKLLTSSEGDKNVARAAALHEKACLGTVAASCAELGELHEAGAGVSKDPIRAEIFFQRGCVRGSAEACNGVGRMILAKPAGGSPDEARRYFQRACLGRSALACAALKVVYGETKPVFADMAQKQAMTRRCAGGSARDCAAVGLLDAAAMSPALGKPQLQRACTMGDRFACAVMAKLK